MRLRRKALTVVAFPLLEFLVVTIARDESIMGQYKNEWCVDVIAGLGYLTIIGIIFNYLQTALADFGITILG